MRLNRRFKNSAGMDMVPMIDIVFQLVLFFTVTTTFIQTPGIKLFLPEAESVEKLVVKDLIITIADDKTIYLNKELVSFQRLSEKLQSFTKEEREKIGAVIVEGDKKSTYETMVKILDIARVSGFENIGLKMRDKGAR